MRARLVALGATMMLPLLGACSESAKDRPSSPAPAPPSSTSTATPSPTASTPAAPTGPAARCLFTAEQVSDVLGGAWTRHPKGAQGCAYSSDRGAVFATNLVEDTIEQGLRDAERACVPGVTPIRTGKTGFVCIEERPSGNQVVGNVATRGLLWIAVIPVKTGENPEPQLKAMTVLLETIPD